MGALDTTLAILAGVAGLAAAFSSAYLIWILP
jgi:hypothetical protein